MRIKNKNLKLALIFFSLFTIILSFISNPSVAKFKERLDDIYQCEGLIKVEYNRDNITKPIVPLETARKIPLIIKHKVTGNYAEYITNILRGQDATARIRIDIHDKPDWCNVVAIPDFSATTLNTEWSSVNTSLYITVDEMAPAFTEEEITIRVRSDTIYGGVPIVITPEFFIDIPFKSGYAPILKTNTPGGTVKKTTPGETVYFDIDLENLGNGKTTIFTDVLEKPDGWDVNIVSNTTLGTKRLNDDFEKKVTLAVYPPYDFGYHDEREVIKISILPTYYDNSSIMGNENILSFVVESKGFSTPGFESISIFMIVFVLILFCRKFNFFVGDKK